MREVKARSFKPSVPPAPQKRKLFGRKTQFITQPESTAQPLDKNSAIPHWRINKYFDDDYDGRRIEYLYLYIDGTIRTDCAPEKAEWGYKSVKNFSNPMGELRGMFRATDIQKSVVDAFIELGLEEWVEPDEQDYK